MEGHGHAHPVHARGVARCAHHRTGDVRGPVKLRGTFLYGDPRGAKLADAHPESGPAGSSLELLVEQVLDDGDRDAVVFGYDEGLLATVCANHWVAREVARAANDWTIDGWLSRDPRLHATVMISTALPQDAAAEVRRAGEHPQMVAVALGGNALAKPFGHALYHPIYEAAANFGCRWCCRSVEDGGADVVSAPVAGGLPATYAEYKVLAVQSHMTHATSLIAHGVFDIFPQLEVLLVGGGVGWIPSFLWRMDYWFKQNAHETPWLKRPPSEYFVRHFRVATHEQTSRRATAGSRRNPSRPFRIGSRCFSMGAAIQIATTSSRKRSPRGFPRSGVPT